MLVLAIPMLIWGVTGSYFVLMDIGFIRSDHMQPKQIAKIDASKARYPIAELVKNYPQANKVNLKQLGYSSNTERVSQLVYQVVLSDKSILINAQTGEQLQAISQAQITLIAQAFQHEQSISANASINSVILLTEQAPAELAARHLPVWQVRFDDIAQSTLYISAQSGDVVTRRHEYWRLFDLFWKWHIMDYDDGEAVDNSLLFSTSIVSLVAVFAGGILIWQRRKRYC